MKEVGLVSLIAVATSILIVTGSVVFACFGKYWQQRKDQNDGEGE